MASCITSQFGSNGCPQARLTVNITSQTATTATLSWYLDIVYHGFAVSSSVSKSWSVTVAGQKWSGSTTIGGTTSTKRVSSGTKTVNKSTSSQSISFSCSFAFNITWAGTYGGTKSASGSIGVGAKTSYSVSYNANGGSGAPSNQTKWHGTNLTLSSTQPTRTGYIFKGWATSATGEVAYAAGATYSANAAVTLYAVWEAITYTVTYDVNGGDVGSAPAAQTKTYGVDLTLSSTIPTRTNYNFLGWGTSAGSTSVSYAAGATYTANAAITLYAVWEIAYTPPRITNFTADRCDADGVIVDEGTYVKVIFDWALDTVYSGGLESITISYKLHTDETYTNIAVEATGMSGSVSQVIGNGLIDTEYEYDVRVTVTDDKGSSYSDQTIATLAYIIDFLAGGSGVAIGKPASVEDLFDVETPTRFCDIVQFQAQASDQPTAKIKAVPIDENGDKLYLENNSLVVVSSVPGFAEQYGSSATSSADFPWVNLAGEQVHITTNAGDYENRQTTVFNTNGVVPSGNIYLKNDKAIAGQLTSGNYSSILRMNPSNQVELNWTTGGLKGRVMKLLWEGTLTTGGSVTIPELPYYNVFAFTLNSGNPVPIARSKGTYIYSASIVYDTNTNVPLLFAFAGTISGTTFKLSEGCYQNLYDPPSWHGNKIKVMEIYGVM